jgi:hypothetical protein
MSRINQLVVEFGACRTFLRYSLFSLVRKQAVKYPFASR